MSGGQIDFKKLIRKARQYPDLETWRHEDPKSYFFAAENNVIERSEISRHMSLVLRARVTFGDVLNDLRFYNTQGKWRDKSPVNFWAAWAQGWLDHPDVLARVPSRINRDRLWSFERVCAEAQKFNDMDSWRAGHRNSYDAAKRNLWMGQPKLMELMGISSTGKFTPAEVLIENPRLLISQADIDRSPDPEQTYHDLQEAAKEGRIHSICEGLYAKGYLSKQNPDVIPDVIASALQRELGWRIKVSCEQEAYTFGMPHVANRRNAYESDNHSMKAKLGHISRKARPTLTIRKVPHYRMELSDSYEDRILRALHAVPAKDLKVETEKAVAKLTPRQLLVLRISLRQIRGPVRRNLDLVLI